MTSFVRISHIPAIVESEDSSNEAKNLSLKMADGRLEKLLSLTDKMDELKKRSESLEDLWAVYEKLDSDELKSKLKAKINEKTQFANSLATQIQSTLELEETKKELLAAKKETDRRIARSPLSSPTPRTSRAFF